MHRLRGHWDRLKRKCCVQTHGHAHYNSYTHADPECDPNPDCDDDPMDSLHLSDESGRVRWYLLRRWGVRLRLSADLHVDHDTDADCYPDTDCHCHTHAHQDRDTHTHRDAYSRSVRGWIRGARNHKFFRYRNVCGASANAYTHTHVYGCFMAFCG